MVAKIRILDADEFLQHNAFRTPGAPSLEELRETPLKADHFKAIYARIHRGITAIPKAVTADNLHLLDGIDFAFLSLDAGEAKAALVARLHERGVAFVDIGMGLELGDHGLSGILRVTTSTPATRDTVGAHARIPLASGGAKEVYASNIQVADLNALNAVMAVIKWKKLSAACTATSSGSTTRPTRSTATCCSTRIRRDARQGLGAPVRRKLPRGS